MVPADSPGPGLVLRLTLAVGTAERSRRSDEVRDVAAVGHVVDVEVRAAAGTTLDAVMPALREAAGLPERQPAAGQPERSASQVAQGRRVDGSAVLGLPPLLQGAVVELGPAVTVRGRRPGGSGADGADGARTDLAATSADGLGHLMLHRGPRLHARIPEVEVALPGPPPEPPPPRPAWLAAVVPVLLAVPLALLWRQPAVLVVAAMAPLLALGNHAAERRAHRRARSRALAAFTEERAGARRRVETALATERLAREEGSPSLAAVARAATGPGTRLWERGRQESPLVRIGSGDLLSAVRVRTPAGVPEAAVLHGGPVTVDLGAVGVLGVAGPRHAVLGLARALVAQLAVWHSPRHLRLVVEAEPGRWPDWAWTAWLPHRSQPGGPAAPEPARTVVIADGPSSWRDGGDPGGQPPGTSTLCLVDAAADLPATCGAVVTVGADGKGAVLALAGATATVTATPAPTAWSERIARSLAAVRDAGPEGPGSPGVLPATVRLVDLLRRHAGVDPLDSAAIARRWRSAGAGLGLPLGMGTDGPWWVDLRRDGPHVLVAGTTGSGKSELLTALVSGLAVLHPPDRLAFVLVDYKGGTAFAGLTGLPHVTGLVTDLDGHLAERALTSLRAELRRRERLLREAGVRDLADLPPIAATTSTTPRTPTTPRLVLVVDEFRVLAEEQPELLAGLVRVAAVGRALGVHLVLATQRPGGAVSPDIRANADLRIGLRVREQADSLDVLDVPDAAALPADRPGRAVARTGGRPPTTVQVATVGVGAKPLDDTVPVQADEVTAVPLPPGTGLLPAPAAPSTHPAAHAAGPATGDGLARLVEAVASAARASGRPPPRPPWVPPLPEVVLAEDLSGPLVPAGSAAGAVPVGAAGQGPTLPFALADLPDEQGRGVLCWRPLQDGSLAVVGGPRSGRTGVLRALAAAAAGDPGLHVHVIDGAGGGGGLSRMAAGALGTTLPASDVERADALLAQLADEARRRRLSGDDRGPVILLLVDGWEAAVEAWGVLDRGRLSEDLLRLARDGAGAGIRLAISGGRALLTGAPASVLTSRLLLRPADPAELLLAGVPARAVPRRQPPGRLLRPGTGHEAVEGQAVLLAADPGAPAQDDALAGHARTAPARAQPPLRLAPLPERVGLGRLRPLHERTVPVGMGRSAAGDVVPVGFDLTGVRAALLIGNPGSGRSTALAALAHGLLDAGRAVVHLGEDTPLLPPGVLRPAPDGPGDEPADLLAVLGAHPGAVVLVDDAARWAGTAVEDAVLRRPAPTAVREGLSSRALRLMVTATTAEATVAFRGLVAVARAERTGLVLGSPTAADGEVFGVRLPAGPPPPPGRGLLVRRGRVTSVQVADPGCGDAQAERSLPFPERGPRPDRSAGSAGADP